MGSTGSKSAKATLRAFMDNNGGRLPTQIIAVTPEAKNAVFSAINDLYTLNTQEQAYYSTIEEHTDASGEITRIRVPYLGYRSVEGFTRSAIDGFKKWFSFAYVRRNS